MMDRKARLVDIFRDTQQFYTENAVLRGAVESSRKATKFYKADEYPLLGKREDGTKKDQQVRVTKHKTFEAALMLHNECPDKRIAVLNFASATNPGGGVRTGSSAQEESLCRCSTLYPTLDRRWLWDQYYTPNRASGDVRHTDDCIYSPGIVICKTDESFPQRVSEAEFVTIDVISCAAPNLRQKPGNWHNPESGAAVKMSEKELYDLHLKRAKHILHIAAANGVDMLVLGAFGCGAFSNDPNVVAKAYNDALPDYLACFDVIEFAIYCRPQETINYDAFKRHIAKVGG